MQAAVSSKLKISKQWSLERYARFVLDREPVLPNPQHVGDKGSWKHYYSTAEAALNMLVIEDNHLMISQGDHIYESFSSWKANKWLRGVTKGDSILFIFKVDDKAHRFKVKFSPRTPGQSSIDACKDCTLSLLKLIPISELSSASVSSSQQTAEEGASHPEESSQSVPMDCSSVPAEVASLPTATEANGTARANRAKFPLRRDKEIPVSEIAKNIQTRGKGLGEAYRSTNFPVEQLGAFIRLCLTDSNFPGFVEAVEKELNAITRS